MCAQHVEIRRTLRRARKDVRYHLSVSRWHALEHEMPSWPQLTVRYSNCALQ